MRRLFPLFSALFALVAIPSWASEPVPGCRMEILVDGRPVPQYPARGTIYVEALKGKDYAIRLYNPFNVRVAVALSVDGLNSIDARRTTATDARKWVLDPYESLVISGWQIDMNHARKFFFTTEQDSYAAVAGKDPEHGVVTAVFFRERVARIEPIAIPPAEPLRDRAGAQGAAGAPSSAAGKDSTRAEASPKPALPMSNQAALQREDYAATGIRRPDRPCRSPDSHGFRRSAGQHGQRPLRVPHPARAPWRSAADAGHSRPADAPRGRARLRAGVLPAAANQTLVEASGQWPVVRGQRTVGNSG